ncbi:hypothetical protein NL676_001121 [Syzygium grande]|nr:hypothetical protein NL676_001121 [Syzygium grande]
MLRVIVATAAPPYSALDELQNVSCIVQPLLLATAAAASSILAIPNFPPLNNDEDAKDTSAPSPDSSIIYRL